MTKLLAIATPTKWQKREDYWVFVIGRRGDESAIEFRMDEVRGRYRVREWVDQAEILAYGWFIGERGIRRIHAKEVPPSFYSRSDAAIAARNYYSKQYRSHHHGL